MTGQFVISTVNPMLRNRVQSGSRLVQDQDPAILVKRPGQTKPLDLSAGKMDTILIHILTNVGLDPLGQTVCPLENTGFL